MDEFEVGSSFELSSRSQWILCSKTDQKSVRQLVNGRISRTWEVTIGPAVGSELGLSHAKDPTLSTPSAAQQQVAQGLYQSAQSNSAFAAHSYGGSIPRQPTCAYEFQSVKDLLTYLHRTNIGLLVAPLKCGSIPPGSMFLVEMDRFVWTYAQVNPQLLPVMRTTSFELSLCRLSRVAGSSLVSELKDSITGAAAAPFRLQLRGIIIMARPWKDFCISTAPPTAGARRT
ncbi:hypothetical protein C8R46DRAFT_1024378 [Mycena filopes]|nr:hypothetical protein C8R46DRAFT_1024378 [Mycena filopes]